MNTVVITSGTSSVLIQINGDSKRVPKNTLQCKFSDTSSQVVGFGYINQSQRLIKIKINNISGNEEEFTTALMDILKDEKHEDETNADYENRILGSAKKVIGL